MHACTHTQRFRENISEECNSLIFWHVKMHLHINAQLLWHFSPQRTKYVPQCLKICSCRWPWWATIQKNTQWPSSFTSPPSLTAPSTMSSTSPISVRCWGCWTPQVGWEWNFTFKITISTGAWNDLNSVFFSQIRIIIPILQWLCEFNEVMH